MALTPSRLPACVAACCTVLLITSLVVPRASAHDYKLGNLTIDHPWARATAGPARNGAAYLSVHNPGAADALVAVAGDVAARLELHTHLMEGDVMKMRPVEAVEVPADGVAELKPGSFHIMLMDLKRPLVEGEHFPLTLTFREAGEVTVEVAVEGIGSMGPAEEDRGGMDHGAHGDHGAGMPSD